MEPGGEEPEPSELFSDLGTLVVEGRMPGGQRGFHEGPHCVLVYPYRQSRHSCHTNNSVCQRESELRRYMHLLWRNNIPMSVEVLLCPPCVHGSQRASAVDAAPEPGYLLLEQWTVHMETAMRCQRGAVGARALLQAVYSYLHFSQLSAWLSRSGGALPRNVMYRITVPGDAFGTRFVGGAPQLHTFPTAFLARDRTTVQVTVRALPRRDSVPTIPCGACDAAGLCAAAACSATSAAARAEEDETCGGAAAPPPPPPTADAAAAAALWSDEDLRRSIAKARLQGALSDSRDSLLGDSLLDPPRSLHKYPKRYQSPSRSGSPSLETPEHLLFGSRDSSAERTAQADEQRSRGLSRRVITDQSSEPDMAWTQSRAPWRPRHHHQHHHVEKPTRLQRLPGSPTQWRRRRAQRGGQSDSSEREEDGQSDASEREEDGQSDASEREEEEERRRRELDVRLCQTEEMTREREKHARTRAVTPERRGKSFWRRDGEDSRQEWASGERPRARAPQRSRSDCSAAAGRMFKLTDDERRQVEAVLRRGIPPPRPPDDSDCSPLSSPPLTPHNPLLSAIERVGHSPAACRQSQSPAPPLHVRTVRQPPPALQVARSSTVCGAAARQAALPLSPPERGVGGLAGMVRRALSFEHPQRRRSVDDDDDDVDPWGRFTAADGGREEKSVKDEEDDDLEGITVVCDRDKVVDSEKASNGVSERTAKVANGTSARTASDNMCSGASKRMLPPNDAFINGTRGGQSQPETNGTCSPKSGAGDAVQNGTSSHVDGATTAQSSNLIKRLFKRDRAAETKLTDLRQQTSAVSRPTVVRRSLDSATATTSFSQRTGLPLSSSPAPMRRGTAFNFDAALTKVKTFSSALNELTDDESAEAEAEAAGARRPLSSSCPAGVVSSLLGSFEESVLNGRLGPVRTVEGFSAEIGASGSFHPQHLRLPVTVFFYSLADNEKIASPYMGHVNLGRKGYHVPKKGTLQVTLFNPHGTVVKMFVVLYDLSAMPAGCQTFLRQRTLYMPVGQSPEHPHSQKWLRYLIHLRFATGRTGRLYVHTDLRMIIFRKSDMDAAALHTSSGQALEMRSFVHMPDNPRFSPRK